MELSRRRFLGAAAALAAGPRRGPAGGTFMQFWAAHREWPEERWQELFGYFERLGVSEVVIQWSRYDGYDYGPLVERVMEWAGRQRAQVWVGLCHDSGWWKALDGGLDALEPLLKRVAAADLELAAGAGRAWRNERAFAGWYLPEELDDAHWSQAGWTEVMESHLRRLSRSLKPLAASGFSNRRLAPAALAAHWARLRRRGGLGRVFFQDGIGSGKLGLSEWPAYAEALGRGLGGRLSIVVELFETLAGGAEFQAQAAPVERVMRQLELARRASRRRPVAFSLMDYATPLGGRRAEALFQALCRPINVY